MKAAFSVLVAFLVLSALPVWCSEVEIGIKSEVASEKKTNFLKSHPYFFTTEAYQRAALRAFLQEVNQVARDLDLPENIPITESNLVEIFIAPPGSGMLGVISTSNYMYFARGGRKLCGIEQLSWPYLFEREKCNYLLHKTQIDTNRALELSMEIMRKAGVNVVALTRDCDVHIFAATYGQRFVPEYSIGWYKGKKPVASLRFLQPTATIRSLQVWDPDYVVRGPVEIPNLGELLRQGNPPKILLQRLGLELTSGASTGTLRRISSQEHVTNYPLRCPVQGSRDFPIQPLTRLWF